MGFSKTKRSLAIALILCLTSSAFAQKFKVRRVKGKQAVIEFSGGTLVPGQTYDVRDDFSSETSDSGRPRRYYFDVSAGFSNSKSDLAGTSSITQVDISSTFGWNFGEFEVGPALAYGYTSSDGINTSTVLAGVYGDWNIIPNHPGEAFTYGLSAFVLGGQETIVGKDLTSMRVQPGVFTKWFLSGSNTGFRVNLGYRYDKYLGNNSSATATGIVGTFSLINYF